MPELIFLSSPEATMELGDLLSQILQPGEVLYLQGELGAGKTTFVRGFLRGLGYQDRVKSPSFSLIEEYDFVSGPVYHFDLFRIRHAEELNSIGLREYFGHESRVLVEWPEKAPGILPPATITVKFEVWEQGRKVYINFLQPPSDSILKILEKFKSRQEKSREQ